MMTIDEINNIIKDKGRCIKVLGNELKCYCNVHKTTFKINKSDIAHKWCYKCEKEKAQNEFKNLALAYANKNNLMLLKTKPGNEATFKCNTCKKTFVRSKRTIMSQPDGCAFCKTLNESLAIREKIAKEHNIKFIKMLGPTARDDCVWECPHGHQFQKSYQSIQREGTYKRCHCPTCKQIEQNKIVSDRKQQLLNSLGPDWEIISHASLTRQSAQVTTKCCHCGAIMATQFCSIIQHDHYECKNCKHQEVIERANKKRWKLSQNEISQRLVQLNNTIKDKGICLSSTIRNSRDILRFKCKCGTEFEANYTNVRYGAWNCPNCKKKSKALHECSLDQILKMEKERNIKLLYEGTLFRETKVDWLCLIHNTVFQSNFNSLKNNSTMCPACLQDKRDNMYKPTLEQYNEIAKAHYLEFIGTSRHDETWRCTLCNKTFSLNRYGIIKNNLIGCPSCSNKLKLSKPRSDYEKIEKEFNITLIETFSAFTANDDVLWKCNTCNKTFSLSYYKTKNHGCPHCYEGSFCMSERKCKQIIESELDITLKKVRPSFLKLSTYATLELDMYDQTHNLAFEYDGPQHFSFIPFFHSTQDDFLKQVKRDRLKDKLCHDNNIKLVRIPFFPAKVDKKAYIKKILIDNNLYDYVKNGVQTL